MVPYVIVVYLIWRFLIKMVLSGMNDPFGHITGIDAIDRLFR